MMVKALIPAQRRRLIHEHLQRHTIARSAALGELLGASEATVRRDLEWLEKQGMIERTHGGAILSQPLPTEPAYALSALSHPEEKRRIGAAAAQLVEDGDTIFLNSGTTTTEVVRQLRLRTDLPNITLITNNVTAALDTREAPFELILLGGSFRSRSNSVVGRFAVDVLRQVYADKAFIGVDGISLKYDCTTPVNAEAEIARVMIERTRGRGIVVADHSKWGVVSNFLLASLEQVDDLVVDDGLGPEQQSELRARGVNLTLAGHEPARGPLKPDGDRESSHAPVLEVP